MPEVPLHLQENTVHPVVGWGSLHHPAMSPKHRTGLVGGGAGVKREEREVTTRLSACLGWSSSTGARRASRHETFRGQFQLTPLLRKTGAILRRSQEEEEQEVNEPPLRASLFVMLATSVLGANKTRQNWNAAVGAACLPGQQLMHICHASARPPSALPPWTAATSRT